MSEGQNFVPQDDHDNRETNDSQGNPDGALGAEEAASFDEVAQDGAHGEPAAGVDPDTRDELAGSDESGVSQEGEPEALSEGDQALLRVTELEDQLARSKADVYNLQQEYNGYVKRSKAEGRTQYESGQAKVIDALLSVLDDAALAKQHGDLEGPAGTIVEKLEQTLETNFKLVRFGAEGDAFDPEIHEALMHSTSADVTDEHIAQLIQPGYKLGDKVLRPARVGVVSPE